MTLLCVYTLCFGSRSLVKAEQKGNFSLAHIVGLHFSRDMPCLFAPLRVTAKPHAKRFVYEFK